MDFMCDWKDSVESRMTPRLWTSVDGEIVQIVKISNVLEQRLGGSGQTEGSQHVTQGP